MTTTHQIPCLHAQGLRCVRNTRCLFSDLDFFITAGESLWIEGANGSGKTSLLRILCGIGLLEAGEILWCGQDINHDLDSFLSEMLYIGHANGVRQALTPLENLQFAHALSRKAPGLSPRDALARLGLDDQDTIPCQRLSAGQCRRVALARLLVSRASVWLLDEPFAALDKDVIGLVNSLLQEHVQQGGMLVMTSHFPIDLQTKTVMRIRLGS